MMYQVDFLLLLKLRKISFCFGLWPQKTLGQTLCRIFTFDQFDMLILKQEVHCCIVLVYYRLSSRENQIKDERVANKISMKGWSFHSSFNELERRNFDFQNQTCPGSVFLADVSLFAGLEN